MYSKNKTNDNSNIYHIISLLDIDIRILLALDYILAEQLISTKWLLAPDPISQKLGPAVQKK